MALAGGVGGAKLVYGLANQLSPEKLVVVGNVADDFHLYGFHISPDLDTVMYTLAGLANPATGWGLAGDSWQMLDMLARYGVEAWFRLGDRDLATHIVRTQGLAEDQTLTSMTGRLAAALGVKHRLLPVTNDRVTTMVETVEHGTLGFQEYFVRHRWQPTVQRVWYEGSPAAQATPQVVQALNTADVVVLCPSNPILSIAPILSVPSVRRMLEARRGKCVAVSPFIGGRAVKGPAAKLMAELGLDISPAGLMQYYAGMVDGLIVDNADADLVGQVNFPILVTNTLMQQDTDKVRLAGDVLEWVGSL